MIRYREVAADLAKRIRSGEFPIGTKLKTMSDFAREYEVSPVTARSALWLLEREGYLSIRQGHGMHVVSIEPVDSNTQALDQLRRELKKAREAMKLAEEALRKLEEG